MGTAGEVVLRIASEKCDQQFCQGLNLYVSGTESWVVFHLAANGPLNDNDSMLTRVALLVYATYRTTNAARHVHCLSIEEAHRALNEGIYGIHTVNVFC